MTERIAQSRTPKQQQAITLLEEADGNVARVAEALGVSWNTIYHRAKRGGWEAPLHKLPPLSAARAKYLQRSEKTHQERALKDTLATLAKHEKTLDAIDKLATISIPGLQPVRLTPGKRTTAAVTMLSDVHGGANFPVSNSTWGNRYNREICQFRLRRFFWLQKYMLDVHSSWGTFDDLVLVILGDLPDGHLHDEQVETSEPPLEAMAWIEPEIIAGCRMLSNRVRLTVCGAYGNHGRLTNKVRWITGHRHNVEYHAYQRMRRELKNDGVRVIATPSEDQYHEVYGWTLHATHGTTVRYQGGIQGVQTPLNKAAFMWDRQRKADYHLLGHLHQGLYGGNWFLNGSMVGFGPHAAALRCTPEPPQQWWFALDKKHGATAMSPLWVSDPEEEAKLP